MMRRPRRPLMRAAMVGGVCGGFHLADAWVHPADLIAVGLIAAEEAAAP